MVALIRSTSPTSSSFGVAAQQHLEEDTSLESGQLRPDARVLAAAERDVRVGMSCDLEVLGVGAEDLLVAVGRAVEHHDRVALADALPADLDVGGRGPRHVRHRGGPAQHLLDRAGISEGSSTSWRIGPGGR